MGFAQIMAMLLVVLPTLAFMIMLLIDYWAVMQADYKLKLVANVTTEFTIDRDDLRDFSDGAGGNASDYQSYIDRANSLCPNNTNVSLSEAVDAAHPNEIVITVEYTHNGIYFKNKLVTTQMNVYSYRDQNLSLIVTCQ